MQTAGSGEEALQFYQAHGDTIDLVILDFIMPELNGPEAAMQIRQIDPDARIIFSTGYEKSQSFDDALSDIKVLRKPFQVNEASKIIRQTLDQ